ncbi:MAG TPA: 4'-phosphopantetheinyl transferase superfamily protein [Polyangiaceae bacterium]|nr:4'-phosphopantetheinyl transferase superfamily protein [Polyangiaceae bacterium]
MHSFRLTSGEVHSWRVSLDVPPETSARLLATLAPDERARSARFRFERDRQHFVVAHGALRELLGSYLGTRPGSIRYVYNAFGKPDLGPEFGARLKFNLTHSAGLALIAVAAGSSLGVDVECIRPRPDYDEIARRFFSAAEVDELASVPSHLYAAAFLGRWTKIEAYLKARGEGFAASSGSFSVPQRWSIHALRPGPGYVGALAIEGSGWRLSERRWTPEGLVGRGGFEPPTNGLKVRSRPI